MVKETTQYAFGREGKEQTEKEILKTKCRVQDLTGCGGSCA